VSGLKNFRRQLTSAVCWVCFGVRSPRRFGEPRRPWNSQYTKLLGTPNTFVVISKKLAQCLSSNAKNACVTLIFLTGSLVIVATVTMTYPFLRRALNLLYTRV
jgi:hypothetical protein